MTALPKKASRGESNAASVEKSATEGSGSALSRRNVIIAGAVGAVTLTAAACSSSTSGGDGSPSGGASGGSPENGGDTSTKGLVIAKTSEVPVGSAALVPADGTTFMVTQPTEGKFVCHSGICTHLGCPLTEVQGDDAVCPCHGSRFNIFSGDVERGPATANLAPINISVSNGEIRKA